MWVLLSGFFCNLLECAFSLVFLEVIAFVVHIRLYVKPSARVYSDGVRAASPTSPSKEKVQGP